jgi:prepilin-type N-terminal cleavage/methylation domain-containing protein
VRAGYTLLEVMLAIAIGLLLVAALYVAMDVQFRYMQTGRDAVVEGQLARGILNRMSKDIRASLAALPNRTTTTPTSTNTQQQGSGSTGTGATEEETTSQTTTTPQFNYGIVGDEYQMTLFVSALPPQGRDGFYAETGQADLRKITYWLDPEAGLARQEVYNLMTDTSMFVEPGGEILASEVTDVRFRYFDPSLTDWVTTWDGSTSGPPLAVEITLTVQAQVGLYGARKSPTSYRMVVGIPSASVPQELVNSQAGVTQ